MKHFLLPIYDCGTAMCHIGPRCKSALLTVEKMALKWIFTGRRIINLYRARAMCRIPISSTRRELQAHRRFHRLWLSWKLPTTDIEGAWYERFFCSYSTTPSIRDLRFTVANSVPAARQCITMHSSSRLQEE